jgi:TRAF-interacting protein
MLYNLVMLLCFDILSRSSDMNLQEEEILKLAFLGNHGNLENAVDVLKRSLAIRNK